MASSTSAVAIVGASLAGARVAEALRRRGFAGRIVLVGLEPHLPYERPPLSKEFLASDVLPDPSYLRASDQWEALDVELVVGDAATAVRAAEGVVALRSGRLVAADDVVLCTGGVSRRLGLPGESLSGVYHLRTLEQAHELRCALAEQPRVVIIGGGFIGAEVASSAAQRGCPVTILEAGPTLMLRGLGQRWGQFMTEQHKRRGVDVRLNVGIRSIIGTARVRRVELDTGDRLDADLVLVATGMVPATGLAVGARVSVDDGIVVDNTGRTSHPNIFAAGDATSAPRWRAPGRVRYESVGHAEHQADAVAASLLGQPVPDRGAPWFWSDQLGLNVQFAGSLQTADEIVTRQAGDGAFAAFHLREGVVEGVFAVDDGRDVRAAMRLIAARTVVDPTVLADPAMDLRPLVKGSSRAVRNPQAGEGPSYKLG